MQKRTKISLYILLGVLCALVITCRNPIMEKWWEEKQHPKSQSSSDLANGGSGDNYGVVVFNTDGGTPQPKALSIAWGSVIGRLRPISRGTDGFIGWHDENGDLWDVETRTVEKDDDVDGDGFITLTLKWQPYSHTTVFIVDFVVSPSSEVPPAAQYIAAGGKVIPPVNPMHLPDDRGFAGWYTESGGIHRWNFALPVSSNVTLYAKWSKDVCTVKFDTKGGTRPDGSTMTRNVFKIPYNEYVQDPGPVVRANYSFGGWYSDSDCTIPWNFTTDQITSSTPSPLTLYAKWELNIYLVNFMITPTGKIYDTKKIKHGTTITRPADPPMLGTGEAFDNWYTETSFLNRWNFSKTVTGNMTLYARFKPQTRTVHFEVNGGNDISRTNFTIHVDGKILDPGTTSRTGYTFEGWFFDPAGTNKINFTNYTVVSPDNIIGMDPLYLYAGWTPNNYSVTFTVEGSPLPAQTQTVQHGERVQKPDVTKTGSVLNGWYTNSGYTGERWNFDTDTVTSNKNLYGKWDIAQHTITFDLRSPPGGAANFSQPPDQYVLHNGLITEPFMPPLPAANKTNYSFYRWDYSTDGGTTLLPWDFNTKVTGTMTLYARWVPPEPDMIWVPRGSFIMGDSGVSGSPATYHAYPTRRVTVDGFYIGRYEVTQINTPDTNRGYQQVMKVNPSQFTANDVRPVERVSWFDAIKYCIELTNMNTGLGQVYTNFSTLTTTPVTTTVTSITSATFTTNWTANGYRLPT